jgi:LysM repeat protein
LKKDIESSKYKEMFNFNIYNSWIKKQIIIPLKQIKDLLNSNLIKLQETLKQITNQIKETTDNSLS